jgi:hypothetical protein
MPKEDAKRSSSGKSKSGKVSAKSSASAPSKSKAKKTENHKQVEEHHKSSKKSTKKQSRVVETESDNSEEEEESDHSETEESGDDSSGEDSGDDDSGSEEEEESEEETSSEEEDEEDEESGSDDDSEAGVMEATSERKILHRLQQALLYNNRDAITRLVEHTPLPLLLLHMHRLMVDARKAGDCAFKIMSKWNDKYNIVSERCVEIFSGQDAAAMDQIVILAETVRQQIHAVGSKGVGEFAAYFTAEFVSLCLLEQAASLKEFVSYVEFCRQNGVKLCRSFHSAKPLIAAYRGNRSFFKNKKRYTFNRKIIVMALLGAHVDVLELVLKQEKGATMTEDILHEAELYTKLDSDVYKYVRIEHGISKRKEGKKGDKGGFDELFVPKL